MAINKKDVIEKFKDKEGDTGSPAVQIGILTERINSLSEHFKKSPKDIGSRYGFLKMIGQRRKLLEYLKHKDNEKYKKVIEKLDLRK